MNEVKVNVVNVHSEDITQENVKELVGSLDGLLVAPGFGNRGIEGKIVAVQYACILNSNYLSFNPSISKTRSYQ